MMKRILPCFLLLWVGSSLAPGQKRAGDPTAEAVQQSRVKDGTFHSASLGRDVHYRVLLPNNYSAPGGRFPVLYLLHGLYGDYLNWDTRTGLETYAKNLPLLIVMPDAADSWYTNSATVPVDKFEDYIEKDLIAEIDQKYRTVREGHRRAIAGLSMGGYGAIKLALKYPGEFAFAGSLSGALNAPRTLDVERPDFRAKLLEVFGDRENQARIDNDVFQLLKVPHTTGYPYFYLACGSSDYFLQVNRIFVQQLSSAKLAYEYHETIGGHEWEYWDSALPPLLQAVDKVLVTPADYTKR